MYEISTGTAHGNSYTETAKNISALTEISTWCAYKIAPTKAEKISLHVQLDTMKVITSERADLLKRFGHNARFRVRQLHSKFDEQVAAF